MMRKDVYLATLPKVSQRFLNSIPLALTWVWLINSINRATPEL